MLTQDPLKTAYGTPQGAGQKVMENALCCDSRAQWTLVREVVAQSQLVAPSVTIGLQADSWTFENVQEGDNVHRRFDNPLRVAQRCSSLPTSRVVVLPDFWRPGCR